MPTFRRLFEPVRLGKKAAKNRVMMLATTSQLAATGVPAERPPDGGRSPTPTASHRPAVAGQGRVGDRLIAFYEERAKGGVGSVVTEALAAHSSSRGRIPAYDPETVPGFRRLAEALHRHDALIIGQLNHGGRQHHASSLPLVSGPSAVACPHSGGTPHEVDPDEIRSIVEGFVRSAANLQEAGLDGVEIHGGQGHLIQQFLSPFSNRRTDAYGGTPANRLRFALEIVDGVRRIRGADFVVGFRLGAEEFSPGGLTFEDARDVAASLAATGQIDYLSITQGNFNSIETHIPDRRFPVLPYAAYPAGIKAATPSVPVVGCGRVLDPAHAEELLAEGQADLIGLCRPLLADAEWADKAARGQVDTIRRCISCNQCWAWITDGQPIGCVHNAATGREREWGIGTVTTAPEPRRVVVVGGGPAGLETARVAAERGHHVTLFEREAQLGGAVCDAAAVPGEQDVGSVAEFLAGAVERAGVDVRRGVEVHEEVVLAEHADVVVVATGARPSRGGLGVTGDLPVYATRDLVRGDAPTVRRAIVFDEDGYYEGCEAARLLAGRGTAVWIVTRFFEVGREIPAASRITRLRALDELGVELMPNSWLARVEGRRVVVSHVYTGREWSIEGVDCLVHAGGGHADDGLYHRLLARGLETHRVGDAYMPRRIADAVREGHQLGRAL